MMERCLVILLLNSCQFDDIFIASCRAKLYLCVLQCDCYILCHPLHTYLFYIMLGPLACFS